MDNKEKELILMVYGQKLALTPTEQIKEKIREVFSCFAEFKGWSPVSSQVINHEISLQKMTRKQLKHYLLGLYRQTLDNPAFKDTSKN